LKTVKCFPTFANKLFFSFLYLIIYFSDIIIIFINFLRTEKVTWCKFRWEWGQGTTKIYLSAKKLELIWHNKLCGIIPIRTLHCFECLLQHNSIENKADSQFYPFDQIHRLGYKNKKVLDLYFWITICLTRDMHSSVSKICIKNNLMYNLNEYTYLLVVYLRKYWFLLIID